MTQPAPDRSAMPAAATPDHLFAFLDRLGASGRFSFGSAELMRETLGVEPGSVTPFAAINDTARRVTVVLDTAMMAHATLNYHPLVNTMTTSIARDDLVKFLAATGHAARIEAVSEPGLSAQSGPATAPE